MNLDCSDSVKKPPSAATPTNLMVWPPLAVEPTFGATDEVSKVVPVPWKVPLPLATVMVPLLTTVPSPTKCAMLAWFV